MKAERGFTLVEVLIALTLFSVIMALALGGFRFSAVAWSSGTQAVDAAEEIHAVRRVLTDWVGSATIQLSGQDITAPLKIGFSGGSQRLEFGAYRPPYPSQGGLHIVEITLSETDGQDRTVLKARVGPADQVASDVWETVAELPGDWHFTFLDGHDQPVWMPDWRSPAALPQVVQLSPRTPDSHWPSFFAAPLAREPFVCVNRALDPNRTSPRKCRK